MQGLCDSAQPRFVMNELIAVQRVGGRELVLWPYCGRVLRVSGETPNHKQLAESNILAR